MTRQNRRIRLGKKRRIGVAEGVVEVVPEAEGAAVLEVADGAVEEEGVSRWEAAKTTGDISCRDPASLFAKTGD
jgi:hypothetical protein